MSTNKDLPPQPHKPQTAPGPPITLAEQRTKICEITLGTGLSFVGTTLTPTGYNFANTERLYGRYSAGTGLGEEITLGSLITVSGGSTWKGTAMYRGTGVNTAVLVGQSGLSAPTFSHGTIGGNTAVTFVDASGTPDIEVIAGDGLVTIPPTGFYAYIRVMALIRGLASP